MKSKGNTIFWAIIACLLWSTAYAGIKIGLEYDTPLHFAGIRFIFSGLIILPLTVKPSLYIRMIIDNWKMVMWVTFLQIVVNYSLFYHGLNLVPGAVGAVVYGAQPLIIAVVAAIVLKNDRFTKRKILTIAAAISGVILISAGRHAFSLGSELEYAGIIMILIANLSTAASNIIISKNSKPINPFVLSSFTLFFGGVVLWLISIPFERGPQPDLPFKFWIVLLWLTFMAATAFSIWFILLQRPGVKVSELNLWKFLTPVSGALLSWWLIKEENPEWLTVSGMIIITVSLIFYYKRPVKEAPAVITET